MAGNFRPAPTRGATRPIRNLVTKEGVLFIEPFLRKPKPGAPQQRKQVTEIRVLPLFDEKGNELALLNPAGADAAKCPTMRLKLAETFNNLEVVRQVGGPPGGKCTNMITSVRDSDDPASPVRYGWTPYYEMCFHLRRKITQQRERHMLGLSIDIPKAWIDWQTSGKFAFSYIPMAGGGEWTDKKGNFHPEQYLVKCVALIVDGEMKGTGGKPYSRPAVFMIPPSAAAAFLATITEPTFEDRELSVDNNRFGDFASLENGHTIEMVRDPDGRYTLRLGKNKVPFTKDEARALDRPWHELVNIPTAEQSIQWIAEAIGDPIAVAFGLRKDPNKPNSGTYEKFLPAQWLKLAETIEPELPKETHEKVLADEIAKMKQGGGFTPAAGTAAAPAQPAAAAPAPAPATDAAKPAFRPPPQAAGVDPARYDNALAQMRAKVASEMAAQGAEGVEPDPEAE